MVWVCWPAARLLSPSTPLHFTVNIAGLDTDVEATYAKEGFCPLQVSRSFRLIEHEPAASWANLYMPYPFPETLSRRSFSQVPLESPSVARALTP